jgi:hypothetical protein
VYSGILSLIVGRTELRSTCRVPELVRVDSNHVNTGPRHVKEQTSQLQQSQNHLQGCMPGAQRRVVELIMICLDSVEHEVLIRNERATLLEFAVMTMQHIISEA